MTDLEVSCESQSHLRKKLSQENLRKFYTTHLQVLQRQLQVKSGVSWALLCLWVVILTGQSQLTVCERKHSDSEIELILSESWLLQVNTCASVYAAFWKFTFESGFRKWLSTEYFQMCRRLYSWCRQSLSVVVLNVNPIGKWAWF